MREILFRGKPICPTRNTAGLKRDGFVYGCFAKLRLKSTGKVQCLIQPVDKRGHAMLLVEVDSETVGQYTGQADKAGTKIFEGDALKEDDVTHNGEIQIRGHIWVVDEHAGCWAVRLPGTEEWDFLWSFRKCSKVIGNIHDNPELIGGGQ